MRRRETLDEVMGWRARVGDLRLWSGLALFLFLLTHFSNHALGLVSLDAMERGRQLFVAVWRNPVTWWVGPAAIVVHLLASLTITLAHRSLRLPALELIRVAIGIAALIILLGHLTQTRAIHWLYGVDDSYAWVAGVATPVPIWLLLAMAALVWLHACIGLYLWLRPRRWFARIAPWALAAAVLIPTLAVLGVVHAARQLGDADQGALAERALAGTGLSVAEYRALASRWFAWAVAGSVSLLVLLLIARAVALRIARARALVAITYDGGRVVHVPPGTSILEASRIHGIEHPSVCGGRCRCSTCRVFVVKGAAPSITAREQTILRRIQAPPRVRLGCQLRVAQPIVIERMLASSGGRAGAGDQPEIGRERALVIMFADIRDYTRLAEHRLAYDVVFILNAYFDRVGRIIESCGGHIDKYMGDGVMALFGLDDDDLAAAAHRALDAATRMLDEIEALNEHLRHELSEPLRLGIAIHAGDVIVGDLGYGRARQLTAIGDVVNTASRLDELNKELGTQILFSEAVAQLAGIDVSPLGRISAIVRGKRAEVAAYGVGEAAVLQRLLSGDPATPIWPEGD